MDKVGSILLEMSANSVQPNKITYTIMIDGYCKLGNTKEATKLLNEMIRNGIAPDTITYNALQKGYCKEREVEVALQNDHTCNTGLPLEEITYNTLVQRLHSHTALSNKE
ncbi:Pentatricopeptide repeat-containing protein [Spatholobus suberectus]|nr:Pentatricopeptide repeat-containing protein [Spatholobus suberectus]